MAQLLIHSFSSHISSQGMACAIVATVSAGTAGQGTLARSGWEQSTEEERTLVLERQEAWLPGATRAPPTVITRLVWHHSLDNHGRRMKMKLNMDVILHIIKSIHFLRLYWLQINLIKPGVVGIRETSTYDHVNIFSRTSLCIIFFIM